MEDVGLSPWALTTFPTEKPKTKQRVAKQTKNLNEIDAVESVFEGIKGAVSMMSAYIKFGYSSEYGARAIVGSFNKLLKQNE